MRSLVDMTENRDIVIAEKIGGLTEAIEGMGGKLDDYCRRNEEQHRAMWSRIDSHGTKISWVMGVGSAVAFFFSTVVMWIKTKF